MKKVKAACVILFVVALLGFSGFPAPPKRYTATLNQAATGNPTAIVHVNTLGGEVVWIRNEAGDYKGELSGAFPPERTFVQISAMSSGLSLEAAPGTGSTVTYNVQKINFDDLAYQNKDNHRVAISITVYPGPERLENE